MFDVGDEGDPIAAREMRGIKAPLLPEIKDLSLA